MKKFISYFILFGLLCIHFTQDLNAKGNLSMQINNIVFTNNSLEFDLFLENQDQTNVLLHGLNCGLNMNTSFINRGKPLIQYMSFGEDENFGMGSYSLQFIEGTLQSQFKIVGLTKDFYHCGIIHKGRRAHLGHFKVTNSVTWNFSSKADLAFQENITQGKSYAQVSIFHTFDGTPTILTVSRSNLKTLLADYQEALVSISSKTDQFQVKPNPASQQSMIYYYSDQYKPCVIRLLDSHGKEMFSLHQTVEQGYNAIPINLENLPSGIYMVSLNDKNQQRLIVK